MSEVTVAVSENTFQDLFENIRDNFELDISDSADFGAFSAWYDIEAHLEGGTVDLRADNTIRVKELDIKWDKLDFGLGIDIPEICIGGFCIIWIPFVGCVLNAPQICIFSADPDISLTLPLGGLITSELSVIASLKTQYDIDPARPAGMNDWDAQDANPSLANHWQVFLDLESVDIDIFDIADMVGDLLENAIDAAIDGLLWFLPGWARDLIKAIFDPVIDIIRGILDIWDDFDEWLSDIFNVSFGLLDLIAQLVGDYFASENPLFEIEDPFPILEAAPNPNGGWPATIVPVKIPVRNLQVYNNDKEMILEGDIG